MKDGWWINYDGKPEWYLIDEHERWIRRNGNSAKLGIPQKIIGNFPNFMPADDRNEFLTYLMKNAPIMRVRAHGSYVTFEHGASPLDFRPLKAVLAWGEENAGDYLLLNVVNLRTNEQINEPWSDFKYRFGG